MGEGGWNVSETALSVMAPGCLALPWEGRAAAFSDARRDLAGPVPERCHSAMPSVSFHVRQQPASDNSRQKCFKELLPVKPNIIMRNLGFVVWVWGRLAPEPGGVSQVALLQVESPCSTRQDAALGSGALVLPYQCNVFFWRISP